MTTRERILAAARDLLSREGVAAVSMRRVAGAVGVSATALYRHFPDKERLLAAAVEDAAASFRAHLADALRGRTPAERLLLAGQGYLRFAWAHPHAYRLLFMAWDDLAAVGVPRPARGELSEGLRFLVERVAECRTAGVLRSRAPDVEVAVACWAFVHGLASLWLGGGAGGQLSLDEWRGLSDRALRAFARRLFEPPAPRRRSRRGRSERRRAIPPDR